MMTHGDIEVPAAGEGSDMQKEAAFVAASGYLEDRILGFAALPVRSLDGTSLRAKLVGIGQQEGASSPQNSAE